MTFQSAPCSIWDQSYESTTVILRAQLWRLTTDEAGCLQDFLFLLLLTPQISERVDDDTKDEVEDNDDDHEEEQQVIYHSGCKQRFLGKEQRQPKVI